MDALEPLLGAETLECHYERHHRGYLAKLEQAIKATPLAGRDLEEIIRTTSGSIFDNAAQVWNHTFYWRCMRRQGGGAPPRELRAALEAAFGSFDGFRRRFLDVAQAAFGSGYVWLHRGRDGQLVVRSTSNAETPVREGIAPLLTTDVWEHAYYLDYRNEREEYVEAFLDHLVNWDFVHENWTRDAAANGREPQPREDLTGV
jgi:Fe-Mn family superoxide dismutase